jgi:hypothetical protein
MKLAERSVLADDELAAVLRADPELLAIADAVASTHRRRRRRTLPALGTAAVAAALIAFALVSPWQRGSGGIVERALAAIGDEQVIHVVTRSTRSQPLVIDLATGVEQPTVLETEVWFDGERGLEQTATRTNGRLTDETLRTPQGGWTSSGRIYTCAWIAAHPVQATRLRISCEPSGENGTTPRKIPEERPTLEPALAGFVTSYRNALERGEAMRLGAGEIGGRPVDWIEFRTPQPSDPITGAAVEPRAEQVAVDRESGKPVLLRTVVGGKVAPESERTIAIAETLARDAVTFSRPAPLGSEHPPAITQVVSSAPATPADVATRFAGRAVWPGAAIGGLPLARTTIDALAIGFGAYSGVDPVRIEGLRLVYGDADAEPGSASDFVVVKESFVPALGYGYLEPAQAPPAGALLLTAAQGLAAPPGGGRAIPTGIDRWQGNLRSGAAYVQLEASGKELLVAAALALAPIPR